MPEPGRLSAPVDRVLPDSGLRMRRLPGEVCLASREAFAPPVEPTPALLRAIERCLDGDPAGMVVTRVSAALGDDLPCADCGATTSSVCIDLGLGENTGLIVEGLVGTWCWSCGTGVARNAQREVAARLSAFDPAATAIVEPSLLYETPAHPRSLQVEISTRCNLTCPYCSHRDVPDKRNLSLDGFRDMLDRVDLTRIDNFDFTGLGEPLMNRDLAAMIAEVRGRNEATEIRVVTNGTLLVPTVYEPLCEAGVTSIAVSVDSLDPVRFARSRRGATLEAVLKNIESLAAYRERIALRQLRIKIKAVLIDNPFDEAERLMAYSARIGLDMPHFSRLDTRRNAVAAYDEPWLDGSGASFDGELLAWAEQRWRELAPTSEASGDLPAGMWPGTPAAGLIHPALLPESDLCRWAIDAAFLTIDGASLSCCETMIDLPRTTFGTLTESTLEALWNGPLFWSYRLPLSIGRVPPGCLGCPHAPRHGVAL